MDFNAARMKRIFIISRSAASFNVMDFSAFINNYQSVLKLTAFSRVHSEICLKRQINLDIFWNVNKSSAACNCGMKGGKFMQSYRNAGVHVIFFNKFRMFLNSLVKIQKNNSFLVPFFF